MLKFTSSENVLFYTLLPLFIKSEDFIMKATGIVRKVDQLGRIVLPIELRRTLNISFQDPIEIFVDNDYIMLKKYEPTCIFCGNGKDIHSIHGKNICASCLSELKDHTED